MYLIFYVQLEKITLARVNIKKNQTNVMLRDVYFSNINFEKHRRVTTYIALVKYEISRYFILYQGNQSNVSALSVNVF